MITSVLRLDFTANHNPDHTDQTNKNHAGVSVLQWGLYGGRVHLHKMQEYEASRWPLRSLYEGGEVGVSMPSRRKPKFSSSTVMGKNAHIRASHPNLPLRY